MNTYARLSEGVVWLIKKQRKEKQWEVSTQTEFFSGKKKCTHCLKLLSLVLSCRGKMSKKVIGTEQLFSLQQTSVWLLSYFVYRRGQETMPLNQEGFGEWSTTTSNQPHSLFLSRYIRRTAPWYTEPPPCPASNKSLKEQLTSNESKQRNQE